MSDLLQHYVTAQADARPEAVAIGGDTELSYGELDEISARLAGVLVESGVRPGERIALLLPHSPLGVIGLLGVYKAGAIAVPLETTGPAARLARALDACRPSCLLGAGQAADLLHEVRELQGRERTWWVGWLDEELPELAFRPRFQLADVRDQPPAPETPRQPDDPAHILYTSGSTGTPKGIVITHANTRHFVDWGVEALDIGADDRNSGHTPLHFDLAMFDLFGTFAAGASLHLVPREANLLPTKLTAFIRERALTQWFSVPSVLGYLHRFDAVQDGDFPDLRKIIWCGEVLPTATLVYWMERLPHARFTNLYGPTETTVASTHYTVPERPADDRATIPIGEPCSGEEVMVLDEDLETVAPGTTGELYIAGPGLSPGYWRDRERTAAAFIADPRHPSRRLYRTGDLGRRDEEGRLHFIGRTDSQIKSRGYRIELGEVEQAIDSLGRVAKCAVVPLKTEGFEGSRICCAWVDFDGTRVTSKELGDELRERLPGYMLPTRWLRMDELPTNKNGKIDRPRLRGIFESEEEAGNAPAAA